MHYMPPGAGSDFRELPGSGTAIYRLLVLELSVQDTQRHRHDGDAAVVLQGAPQVTNEALPCAQTGVQRTCCRPPGRRPIPAVLDDLLLVADDAVLVQEASIIAGMRMLLDHAGLVVEPSAALGIAAILEDRDRFAGRHVVTILCGSNVDLDAYHRWVGARWP